MYGKSDWCTTSRPPAPDAALPDAPEPFPPPALARAEVERVDADEAAAGAAFRIARRSRSTFACSSVIVCSALPLA